ncbi:MAG TPA: DUF4440 domain-containing protein [Bacteroidales bacterium]|nr:DUF4440 domain-containing protein [Bacteroidales bacterium]
MKTTYLFHCLLMVLFLASCTTASHNGTSADDLKQIDLDFSEYSISHGMNAAFLAYADSSAILLRPGMPPVEGVQSVALLLRQTDDSRFNLSWQPTGAGIAQSGDLGYTYGIYTWAGRGERTKGTYVTIWQRNREGEWKFVLDTGNAGLGEEN